MNSACLETLGPWWVLVTPVMPGAWLDEWPPGLMLDHILEQVFLCCPWFSSFSLVADAKES